MKVSITWKEIVHACRRRKADCVMKWIVHCLLDSVTLANLLVFLSLVSETWQWFQFFQQIADGQRELIESYSIKKRHFIGNTSMDACLSFIMANHGRVKPNDIVYDPFVGTGTFVYFSTGRKKPEGLCYCLHCAYTWYSSFGGLTEIWDHTWGKMIVVKCIFSGILGEGGQLQKI